MSDADPRVRLEVVRALEKLQDADALSSLLSMTDDSDMDVRHSAVIAMGASGSEHEVFALQELFTSDAARSAKIIQAIGHIGGPQAKIFLFDLLDRDAHFRTAGLKKDIVMLREEVLKALAKNPDAEIVAHIEHYCQEHNMTFRIPITSADPGDPARVKLGRASKKVDKS